MGGKEKNILLCLFQILTSFGTNLGSSVQTSKLQFRGNLIQISDVMLRMLSCVFQRLWVHVKIGSIKM